MKIITISIEEDQLKKIDALVGDKNLFPSRSELARVAVRDFLLHHFELIAEKEREKDASISKEIIASDTTIQIRFDTINENDGSFQYKTYRIIKK